jgi:SAM-dependent methyltransferase
VGVAGDVSDGWTERAQAWARHWPRLSEPARAAVAEATGIAAGTRVLDAGCGSGEFCALALSLGARVSGIDASEGMLAVARGRAPGADLRAGDIQRLPYGDGAFDVVTRSTRSSSPTTSRARSASWRAWEVWSRSAAGAAGAS